VYIDKVERNCYFPAGTAWLIAKCYKVFPIRVKYRSIKEQSKLIYIIAVPAASQEVTVAFNFISERTVWHSTGVYWHWLCIIHIDTLCFSCSPPDYLASSKLPPCCAGHQITCLSKLSIFINQKLTFSNHLSKNSTLTSSLPYCPYQKDERAKPGYILSKWCSFSVRNKVSRFSPWCLSLQVLFCYPSYLCLRCFKWHSFCIGYSGALSRGSKEIEYNFSRRRNIVYSKGWMIFFWNLIVLCCYCPIRLKHYILLCMQVMNVRETL
jgi:hypothetical protein